MRFERVRAISFGPLQDSTLEFKPGFNLIYGPNEAGKSSWHAAIYAGLCGMRRGRGRPLGDDEEFGARHRPWDGSKWKVGVDVLLADGRKIELLHELDSHVYSVVDQLGRSCMSEIIHDGAPDGSKWLGLDRRSFLATACIRQMELLEVTSSSELLQKDLQRAAATAGTQETAAGAIALIDDFLSEKLGSDRANSRKRLRAAIDCVESSGRALDEANSQHGEYLHQLARADEAAARAEQTARHLALIEAHVAFGQADVWARRAADAEELTKRYPMPPSDPSEDERLISEVSAALELWDTRPEPQILSGQSAEGIRGVLKSLPEMPEGDATPDAGVMTAREEVRLASARVSEHTDARPQEPSEAPDAGAGVEELRELADDLAIEVVEVGGSGVVVTPPARRSPVVFLGAAGVLVLFGLGLVMSGSAVPGAVLLTAAAAAVAAVVARRSVSPAGADRRSQTQELVARRRQAHARVHELGLSNDPPALRRLADRMAAAGEQKRRLVAWEQRRDDLELIVADGKAVLDDGLRARGAAASGDVLKAAEDYETACRRRAPMAAQAGRRKDIERELEARVAAERAAAVTERARSGAGARVLELSSRLGLSAPDPNRGQGLLRAWRKEKLGEVSQRRRAVREWARLEELLQGGSLDELRAEAERLQKRADQTRSRHGLAEAEVKSLQISDHQAEDAARKAAEQARAEAERRKGMVEELTKRLPNVAVAEEDLSAAEVELSSVGRLQSTLQRTREFLLDAQERVHLDIAPHLQGSVERWLEDVTEGRYREVRVDPEKLEVKVRTNNGEFRDATYLSHGTAEQIYLLLRVGLAEHLTRRGEACPLLLDDVLVQCDSTRKRAVVEVLKEISTERQVILFSQEDEVLAWGQQHLTEDQHSIRELDPNEIAE